MVNGAAVKYWCQRCRAADWQEPLILLNEAADAGISLAAAPAAELNGFLGRWERAAELARQILISQPNEIYAGNVFEEMPGVIVRAGVYDTIRLDMPKRFSQWRTQSLTVPS